MLPDAAEADDVSRSVREGALEYLERHAQALWPRAVRDGRFDWNVLFDPEGRLGRDRLEAQYLRANVGAGDRYVTTPAGSVRFVEGHRTMTGVGKLPTVSASRR